MHVGPAGVLALPAHVTRPVLEVMLSDAHEFVAEWLEMRPVFQHRLFGQCLRPPLQVEIHARSQDEQSLCTNGRIKTANVCEGHVPKETLSIRTAFDACECSSMVPEATKKVPVCL